MKEIFVNQRYKVMGPDWQAEWDGWTEWERRRFTSMEESLSKGDILFDIGAEDGIISAIYAQFVGAENMCLLEPAIESWPNIREVWEMNGLADPLACFQGFADTHSRSTQVMSREWPQTDLPPLERRKVYKYIHDKPEDVPSITLDDWSNYLGVVPDAITIDVEGAEFRVLSGATHLLKQARPVVWCSVHPDLMMKDYGETDDDVHRFMRQHGYHGELLGSDHEQHFKYSPL